MEEKFLVPKALAKEMDELNIETNSVNKTLRIAMHIHSKQLSDLNHKARKWWEDLAKNLGFSLDEEWELVNIGDETYVKKNEDKGSNITNLPDGIPT
jgi:sensor domain CHASE-containing protein